MMVSSTQSFMYDDSVLQAEFIELLFKEDLINKETYYKAKELLKEESGIGNSKQVQ